MIQHSFRETARLTGGGIGLEIHHGMAGMFLPFACFGEEAMDVMSSRRRQLVFDAPHFLQQQVSALTGFHSGCPCATFARCS